MIPFIFRRERLWLGLAVCKNVNNKAEITIYNTNIYVTFSILHIESVYTDVQMGRKQYINQFEVTDPFYTLL